MAEYSAFDEADAKIGAAEQVNNSLIVSDKQSEENELRCTIRNIAAFKSCLESVRYKTEDKKFQDVLLQVHEKGVGMKSAAPQGNIMTRCLIRKDFFDANSFQVTIKKPEHIRAAKEPGHDLETLIEFCLPFTELKHIVDGMVEEENPIELAYPVMDNLLEIRIHEESKGTQDKVIVETSLQLETYEATHSLDADYSFKSIPIAAEIWGNTINFKRAMREFAFLNDDDVIAIETSETYPKLQFVFRQPNMHRYHVVKFNEGQDQPLIKKISEFKSYFSYKSLDLAFNRVSSDTMPCIMTLNQAGQLSVKQLNDERTFLIESLVLKLEDYDSDLD